MKLDGTAIIVASIYAISQTIVAIIGLRRSSSAKIKAQEATNIVTQVSESVGPANGKTLRELLEKNNEFWEYQHKRNHDILNMLVTINMKIDYLGTCLDVPMHSLHLDLDSKRNPSDPNST